MPDEIYAKVLESVRADDMPPELILAIFYGAEAVRKDMVGPFDQARFEILIKQLERDDNPFDPDDAVQLCLISHARDSDADDIAIIARKSYQAALRLAADQLQRILDRCPSLSVGDREQIEEMMAHNRVYGDASPYDPLHDSGS